MEYTQSLVGICCNLRPPVSQCASAGREDDQQIERDGDHHRSAEALSALRTPPTPSDDTHSTALGRRQRPPENGYCAVAPITRARHPTGCPVLCTGAIGYQSEPPPLGPAARTTRRDRPTYPCLPLMGLPAKGPCCMRRATTPLARQTTCGSSLANATRMATITCLELRM